LVVSQLLTLYITPVIYVYMERMRGAFKKTRPRRVSVEAMHQPQPTLGD
jgi:hypothetical protein